MINVLVMCATDASIDKNNLGDVWKSFYKLIGSGGVGDEDYYNVNVVSGELDASGDRNCIADLTTTNAPAKLIKDCFGGTVKKFDVIILEYCPKQVNTTRAFKNYHNILVPGGKIIMTNYRHFHEDGMEQIRLFSKYIVSRNPDTMDLIEYMQHFYSDPVIELKSTLSDIDPKYKEYGIRDFTRDDIISFLYLSTVENYLGDPPQLTMFDDEPVIDERHLGSILRPLGFRFVTDDDNNDNIIVSKM